MPADLDLAAHSPISSARNGPVFSPTACAIDHDAHGYALNANDAVVKNGHTRPPTATATATALTNSHMAPSPSPSPVPQQQPVSPTRLTHCKSESAVNDHHHHTTTTTTTTTPERRATTGAPMFNEAAPKDRIDLISDYLHAATSIRPLIGVVCGSGLGGLSKCLTRTTTVKYEDIPEFPKSTVEGHAGELVFGYLDAYPVVCMRGRFHSYEGYEMRETALPIRVMYLLGIKYLLVTNAAGGLNPDYNVGDIMVMNDHLNMPGLAGKHPLVGPNDARFGQRFTPLSECYDRKLQALAHATAERLQLTHRVRRKGVYCFVSGPTYETPTESKLLRLVGGDAVGMSTVPEVIVASHCGLRVLGLSLITNKAIFPGEDHLPAASHEEVLEATQLAQRDIESYVRELIWEIGQQDVPQ